MRIASLLDDLVGQLVGGRDSSKRRMMEGDLLPRLFFHLLIRPTFERNIHRP